MIKINLLPKEFVPKQRNFIPYLLLGGLTIVLLVWYGTGMVTNLKRLATSNIELQALNQELTNLEDAVRQVENLESEKVLASQKEKAVEQIMSGRTKWSHELFVLEGLVPNDIWLQNVGLSFRRRPVTIDAPNPDRAPGKPPTIKKTVMQSFPALRLSGYALSPRREEGVQLVGKLIDNIHTDEVFSKRFIAPEMLSIERHTFEEHTVMKFVVDCEILQ
jgi:hypothetical protein